MKIPPLKAEF